MNLTRKRSPRKKRSEFGYRLTIEWWTITLAIVTASFTLPVSATDAIAYQNTSELRENSAQSLTKLQALNVKTEMYATDMKFANDTMVNYTGSSEHKTYHNYTINGVKDVKLHEISNLDSFPAVVVLTENVSEINMAATESVPRNVMDRYQYSNLNDSMEALLEEKFYGTTFGNRFNTTTLPPFADVQNKTQSNDNNTTVSDIQNIPCPNIIPGWETRKCEATNLNTSNVANNFSSVSDLKDVQINSFELVNSAENMVSDFNHNMDSFKDSKFNASDVKLKNADNITVTVQNVTENTSRRIIVDKNSSDLSNKTMRNRKNKRIVKLSEELSVDGSLDDEIIEEYDDAVRSGDRDEYDHTTVKTKLKGTQVDVGAFGVIQKLAEGVLESLSERIIPKGLRDILKRLQDQNSALETIRLRSKEENGGIGIFGRSILKGLADPLSQWMQGVRDYGALDSDRGFMAGLASGLASGVASVADGVSDAFKVKVTAIFPGTLWCGDGHLAHSAEVGLFFLTDNCCRRHDACRLYIQAGRSDYGLTNTGLFTRSHCSCDSAFYRCLKRTSTLVSAQIGATYFSILGPQCFKRAHPIVRCARRTRITGQKCEEYEMDMSQPKIWQWFDNPTF